jgi:hypothetical protein
VEDERPCDVDANERDDGVGEGVTAWSRERSSWSTRDGSIEIEREVVQEVDEKVPVLELLKVQAS